MVNVHPANAETSFPSTKDLSPTSPWSEGFLTGSGTGDGQWIERYIKRAIECGNVMKEVAGERYLIGVDPVENLALESGVSILYSRLHWSVHDVEFLNASGLASVTGSGLSRSFVIVWVGQLRASFGLTAMSTRGTE
jgi:hypothetical protein